MDGNIDESDSDDELLDLHNNPINLRINRNSQRLISVLSSDNKSVITGPPGKFPWSEFISLDENWDDEKIPMFKPTMEVIDSNRVGGKKNRYQRMKEIKNIIGFVVNVHDATNFDIDLELPPNTHEKYKDVISNQYVYQDPGPDFLENPDINKLLATPTVIGTTYRCRLRGVGINQSTYNTWKSSQICVEIKQLIDRTDGWIICTLSDIDVYQRLLIDIEINTASGSVNLRDYLLTRMSGEEQPLFYAYSGKREIIRRKPREQQT